MALTLKSSTVPKHCQDKDSKFLNRGLQHTKRLLLKTQQTIRVYKAIQRYLHSTKVSSRARK